MINYDWMLISNVILGCAIYDVIRALTKCILAILSCKVGD